MAAVGEIASGRQTARRQLPLGLSGETLAGPAREGVGLVKADMTDGLRRLDLTLTGEREDSPFAVFAAPIERRPPALLLHRCPAVGQPEFGPAVAAIGDEFEKLASADRACRQAVRLEPDLVARSLIVEGKALSVVADFLESVGELDPGGSWRRRGDPVGARRLIGRQ